MTLSIERFFSSSQQSMSELARARELRLRPRMVAGLLGTMMIGLAGQTVAQELASTAPKRTGINGVNVPVSQLSLPAPTRTIHWAINRDGSVELSDQPSTRPAARRGVKTYTGVPNAESTARARRDRDYWRAQSDAFAQRQRDRNRALEVRHDAMLDRIEHQPSLFPSYIGAPTVYRSRPANSALGWREGWAPSASGSGMTPQAAALGGGASPFLSSGFARK